MKGFRGGLVFPAALVVAAGCTTPPAVKQAMVSLDQGYDDDLKSMKQYAQIVRNLEERYKYWNLYTQRRAMLSMAAQVIATDVNQVKDAPKTVDAYAQAFGDAVAKVVDELRLSGLPEAKGASGEVRFAAGTGDMDKVVARLPELVDRIIEKTQKDYEATTKTPTAPFESYETNVAALRELNAAIRRYLDVDVTVKPADIAELKDSIQKLRQ